MIRNAQPQVLNVRNLGLFDRTSRVLLAAAMFAPIFANAVPGPLGVWTLAPLLAIYPLLTALLGWDPLYDGMGISTAKHTPEPIDAVQTLANLIRLYHGDAAFEAANGADVKHDSSQRQRAA